MTQKIKLTVEVNVTKVEGKAKFLTHAMIRSGNIIVGTGKLAGKYNPDQALAEFTKNPKRFTLTPAFAGLTPDTARALAA